MVMDLMLGELIYLVIGEGAIIIVGLASGISVWQYGLGFLEGVIIAAAIMIHMAVSVEDSVTMYEEEALKYTRKNYIIRMIVLLAVFLVIIFFKLGDIIAALFGLMALKVSAYIQPFTHKFTQKNK